MDNIEYLRAQEERIITLNEWCQAYYNCDIKQFPEDKVDYIHQIAQRTIELQNQSVKGTRRVNEQGNDTEEFLLKAITEVFGFNFTTLGNAYPDIKGKTPILEYPLISDSKIRKNLSVGDSLRIFYTSTPKSQTVNKKSLQTSYHLLFLFEHDGNHSLNGNYRVADLCDFRYTSKGRIQEGSYNDILRHNKFIAERLI
jgi:hypothetical protein